MDKLLTFLFGLPWQLIVAFAVYGLCAATWKDLWKSEPGRKRWAGYLIQNNRYRSIMRRVLDWIDARLTPEINSDGWQPTEVRSAWSQNLLGLMLLLALVYPILSLFSFWVATGDPGKLGTFTVIPEERNRALRLAALGLFGLSVILYALAGMGKSLWRWALFIAATGILFAFQVVLPENTVALAFALAFTGAFAGAVAFAFAVAGAVAFAFAGAVAFAGAGAFAFAVATAVAFGQEWLGRRTGRPTLFLLTFVLVGVLATGLAVTYDVPQVDQIAEDSSVILFIGFLPLLNALADFASTGLTRFCLRQGIDSKGRPFLWSLADLAGGLLIFIALVIAMMTTLAWVRWPDGTALLDLGGLFDAIRADPGGYWWLYLTFLSTLLPTLVHLGIALFATVFEMWTGLREYIVNGLDEGGKGDDPKGRWAVRALCLTMTAAIMAPITVFGWAIQSHGWVGGHALDGFEWIARSTGMI